MKKTAAILFAYLLICLFAYSVVHAQTFDAKKAYSDYQFQLSTYQSSHSDFLDSKSFYQQNPTLQLKEDVRTKTLKMLKDRDTLIASYITALRLQIMESTGFSGDEKGSIFTKIDSEVGWYKTHIGSYSDGDSLDALFTKSDESMNHYKNTSLAIIYESLFDIGLSQEIGLRIDHQNIYSDLKKYINDQVALGKLKIDPFNRWITDTDNVLTSLQQNEALGKTQIQKVYDQIYNISSAYDTATQTLTDSVGQITLLNNYLIEMLVSIQNLLK